MDKLNEIRSWLKERPGDKANRNTEGSIILFEGESKEQKLESALALGKEFKKEVYNVDLSKIVSKYIDETEKNLSVIFKKAESKKWILFFDEADALFGKRTNVRDSHDRYANQEVSYLLQRIEAYQGVIIISVNNKETLDEPVKRRIRYIVSFK